MFKLQICFVLGYKQLQLYEKSDEMNSRLKQDVGHPPVNIVHKLDIESL